MYSIVILTKFSRPLTRFCMYSVHSVLLQFRYSYKIVSNSCWQSWGGDTVLVPPWPQSHPTHFEQLVDVRLHHCHHLLRWRGRLHHASTPPSSICCRYVLGLSIWANLSYFPQMTLEKFKLVQNVAQKVILTKLASYSLLFLVNNCPPIFLVLFDTNNLPHTFTFSFEDLNTPISFFQDNNHFPFFDQISFLLSLSFLGIKISFLLSLSF